MVACRDKDSYQLVCYGKRVRRNTRRLEGEVRPGKWLGSGHVAERVVMMLSDILFHERLTTIKPRLARCSALRVLLLHSCGAMFSGHWIGAVVRDPSLVVKGHVLLPILSFLISASTVQTVQQRAASRPQSRPK